MASANLATILLTLLFLYVAHRLFSLARNYLAAKRTGLPVFVNPTSLRSPVWILGKPLLKRVFASWDWIHRIEIFSQRLKFATYQQVSSRAFWILDHSRMELYVADPVVAEDVLKRCRVEFPKNREMYKLLDILGPNVISTNGKTWERHRRVTVPPFSERVSESVWEESARQAEGARKKWFACKDAEGVRSTEEDTTRMAFNILSAAGFGLAFDFAEPQSGLSEADRKAGRKMSYRDALDLLINDVGSLVLYMLARSCGWPVWAMWGSIKATATARKDYMSYMGETLRKEREEIQAGGPTDGSLTLMRALVRDSDLGLQDAGAVGKKGKGPLMTDDEILGNLFVYYLAGHDTTAGVLNYAVTLLACMPEWQEWLAEEIDAVVREDQTGLKFSLVFPKLHRCLALMVRHNLHGHAYSHQRLTATSQYETLRIYAPIPVAQRNTGASSQVVQIEGKQVTIPPRCEVKVDLVALHHDPRYWGPDPLEFRPDRWIPSAAKSNREALDTCNAAFGSYDWQSESLIAPTPGTFLPWTGGPRVCPGKKFSQVEFTRAILALFRDGARVRVVQEEGESPQQARSRAHAVADEIFISFTMKMKDSAKIGLEWYSKGQSSEE